MSAANPYLGAYPWLASRSGVWREIVRHVQHDARGARTVVELGAGYCDFINQFPALRKLAFDCNPDMARFAAPDVEMTIGDCSELPGVETSSVDLVFASNFLEHFDSAGVSLILANASRVLRPSGRLILLQPNHRRCQAHYFDDPTHVTIFDDRNLPGFLAPHGLRVVKLVPGLLPFSMKSRLPRWPLLVRIYLASPIRPMAAQMYVVAERSRPCGVG